MTSLTRERFFQISDEIEKNRITEIDTARWGKVFLRIPDESVRTAREFFFLDDSKKAGVSVNDYRIYRLVDWVVDEEGNKLFTDADVPELSKRAGAPLDQLLEAIAAADRDSAKNELGVSEGTPTNSDETPDSSECLNYA